MPSLFLTVGSTLFPALTDLALSPAFLEVLASHGVTEVTVQYGSADITVPPSGQNGRMNGKGEGSFVFRPDAVGVAGAHQGAVALAQRDGLRVRFMRYTSQFDAEVAGADMVISHAGSGSILSALRAHKPLLVIPNNSLMDNHQSELANALDKEGYMGVSSVQTLLDDLLAFFTRAQAHTAAAETPDDKQDGWHADQQAYRPFPELATGRFASILDDVAGFSA